ncbi:MAG: hypothetical protein KGJ13_06445 [Patescibacteria group bacterium]|nr:hypothetical protein [Patescibacteria group bacterium]
MTAYASSNANLPDNIQEREPEFFAAGDWLLFQRNLPTFLPSNGWILLYVLTDENGVEQATVTSVVGSGDYNNWHIISVTDFVPTLPQADYILTGYAVNGAERRQIYYGWLHLTPDYPAGTATSPQTTFSQQYITALEAKLLRLEGYDFSSTDVQRNRFMIEERDKTLNRLKWAYEKRRNEVQVARGRNGQPTGAVTQSVFNIG